MFNKKKRLVLLATMLCQLAFSQISTTPSLGWSTFVKGMSGVDNLFTIPDNSYTKVFVVFSGANTYDSLPATSAGPNWELTRDMGTLLDENVSISLHAFDASDAEIDYAIDFDQILLLPEPVWLSNAYSGTVTLTNVNAANHTISFNAQLPVKSMFDSVVPDNIKGLRGKALQLTAKLDFAGVYDIVSHTTTCPNNPSVIASLEFVAGSEDFTIPLSTVVSVDDSFNPILTVTQIQDFSEFRRSLPISKIPVGGPVCLSIDAEFSVSPRIKGQVVVGIDNNGDWGFIDNSGQTTSLLGKVSAKASVNGSVQALCGVKRSSIAKGSLGLEANIGGGASYTSASGLSSEFGGDFRVYGSLSFPWPFRKFSIHEATLYGPVEFGDTSNLSFKVSSTFDDFFGSSSSTSRSIETDAIPEAWPFGNLSARDSGLVIGWIDDINVGSQNARVELSYYSSSNNTFEQPLTIEENDHGIHNLSTALTSNGNTALTWVQSRYENNQIDTNMAMDAVMASEDIWLAIYNHNNNQVIYKGRIADDTTQNESGRSEGNPKLVWNNSNSGLIVWEVADNAGSDIYFSRITDNSGTVTVSSPVAISGGIAGMNYNPQVAFTDATHAIALWINDSDDDDSTANAKVYESIWNGNAWSAPTIRYNLPTGTEVKDISIQTNGQYGIEAFTYEGYLANDANLLNGVAIGTWSNSNPGNAVYQVEEDSLYYYQLPKATISSNGIASVIIQVREVTDPEDEGSMEMYLKDIPNNGSWTEVSETSQSSYLQYLNDTLNTIWEMSNTFGYYGGNGHSDILYLLTQEADTSDNTNISYGSLLGNPDLHMVLRAFEVNSNAGNISIQDIAEPEDTAIYNDLSEIGMDAIDFELSQNTPNPFSGTTKIKFKISYSEHVDLTIYDSYGRCIGSPIKNQSLPAGNYTTDFNSGNMPDGIYNYRLTVNGKSISKHMVLMR